MPEFSHFQQDSENRQSRLAEDGASPTTPAQATPSRWAAACQELRRRILHTTPSWFAVNMGTGITSILLHLLPYQFQGLKTISTVIFALNVLLFAILLTMSIARYAIWPSMLPVMLFHPAQSFFLGTLPMGFITIVNMVVLSIVPAWGTHWVPFAWTLWWIDSIVSVIIAIGLPFVQFTRQTHSFDGITAIWLLPVVAPIVAAASGATLASVLPNPSHSQLTLTVSYIMLGTGLPLALMLQALYFGRLAIHKLPPAGVIISAFLPIGPCGQSAYALLSLAKQLGRLTERTGKPPFGLAGDASSARLMAQALHVATVPCALVLWGLGFVWLILAVASVADMGLVTTIQLGLGSWGSTFPVGTLALASIELGEQLDSTAFRVIGTILTGVVTALWLFLITITVYRGTTGVMFFSPCLAAQGGEPPKESPPSRKYAYQPRASSSNS